MSLKEPAGHRVRVRMKETEDIAGTAQEDSGSDPPYRPSLDPLPLFPPRAGGPERAAQAQEGALGDIRASKGVFILYP